MENSNSNTSSLLTVHNFAMEFSDGLADNKKGIVPLQLFTEEDLEILDKSNKPEPNWLFMFFEWMPESMRLIYFDELESNYNYSNLLFIKGLLFEYGYRGHKFDPKRAIDYYLHGASINNQFCLFKLFYVLKDKTESEKFGQKKDIDLAMFFLIKASCYNECFLDINKIDPIIKLMHITYFRDKDLNRIRKLLEKMKYSENRLNLSIDDLEYKYLYYFIRLNFTYSDFEFKDAIINLEQISDKHNEACYKLACFYYNPIHKEIYKKNVDKSLAMFDMLFNRNYSKSYCSYYKICEELKQYDKIETILRLSKKNKTFSFQFYANFLSKNKDDILSNSHTIFKYFFKSFLYGNLISVVISFEILSQIFLKNLAEFDKNKNYATYLQSIYDFVSTRKDDKTLFKILDYDILILFHQIHAYFYYKGIIVKKNVQKAIDILEYSFKDKKSVKNYRKAFYYIGKAYEKIGDRKKSNFFLGHSFDIYIMLKEFPYHHFIVGKLFLKGIEGKLEKNVGNAVYFFNMGASYNDNYFFINSFYSKKCINYLKEKNELKEFITNHNNSISKNISINDYINEEDLCIICYSNFKQVIAGKCGHKCLCLICFEKMNKTETASYSKSIWKCPMCQTENKCYINTFSLMFDPDK